MHTLDRLATIMEADPADEELNRFWPQYQEYYENEVGSSSALIVL